MERNKLLKTNVKTIMTKFRFMGMLLWICTVTLSYAQTKAPAPFGTVPNSLFFLLENPAMLTHLDHG